MTLRQQQQQQAAAAQFRGCGSICKMPISSSLSTKLVKDIADEMQAEKRCPIFKSHLRAKCFVIGYWHLIASLFNILTHVAVVYVLTNGFGCEISKESIHAAQWDWLEPILLVINFGAHGFYSFPLIFNYHQYYNNASIDYLPIPANDPPCYPGISHLNFIDISYFVISIIWLKFVLSFISAVHKKAPGPMFTFFVVTSIKLVIQLGNFCIQSSYNNAILDIVYKIVDVCLIIIFLIMIKKYIGQLRREGSRERPPDFIEGIFDVVVMLVEKPKPPEETKEKF